RGEFCGPSQRRAGGLHPAGGAGGVVQRRVRVLLSASLSADVHGRAGSGGTGAPSYSGLCSPGDRCGGDDRRRNLSKHAGGLGGAAVVRGGTGRKGGMGRTGTKICDVLV